MFRIGEFSKMSGVTINTLYHYDQIGILQPAYVDSSTGYRYYEADQLLIINKIMAFKDAGFSLKEIADILNSTTLNPPLIKMLEAKVDFIDAAIHEEIKKLERLRTNIFLIKNGGIPRINDILIKKVEPILIASLRKTFFKNGETSYHAFCEDVWQKVNQHIDSLGGKRTIPCLTLYHHDSPSEQDMEAAEPITRTIPGSRTIKVYELPSVNQMASIVHKGPFATIGKTYQRLSDWISENGFIVSGAVREIYHKGDWATDNPEEYITELQFPIK